MEYDGDGKYIFFPYPTNRNTYLEIKVSNTYVKYLFSDGSFVNFDSTNANVTRFNSSNNVTDTYTAGSGDITGWSISSYNNAIIQAYIDFENTLESPPENSMCYEPRTEVAVPCFLKNEDAFSINASSTSSCSYENNYLSNHGYNGYSTMSRCLRNAESASMLTALTAFAACTVGQVTVVGCGLALTGMAVTTGNYNQTAYQCQLTHDNASRNLAVCLDNDNPSGEVGGGGGGGGGGGVTPPNYQSKCYEITQHAVCTGGGCTYWSEINITDCP